MDAARPSQNGSDEPGKTWCYSDRYRVCRKSSERHKGKRDVRELRPIRLCQGEAPGARPMGEPAFRFDRANDARSDNAAATGSRQPCFLILTSTRAIGISMFGYGEPVIDWLRR